VTLTNCALAGRHLRPTVAVSELLMRLHFQLKGPWYLNIS
jgi:hypothetical protein